MSDHTEDLRPEDVSIADRPLSIPGELPILPLRDTVLFPNSFMPLAAAVKIDLLFSITEQSSLWRWKIVETLRWAVRRTHLNRPKQVGDLAPTIGSP